jgi:hypothetical protein
MAVALSPRARPRGGGGEGLRGIYGGGGRHRGDETIERKRKAEKGTRRSRTSPSTSWRSHPRQGRAEVHRNRRRSAATVVGEKRPCRRFEAREDDSLDEDDQRDEAVLLVLLGRRGAAGSGGSMVNLWRRWRSVVTEKKGEGENGGGRGKRWALGFGASRRG